VFEQARKAKCVLEGWVVAQKIELKYAPNIIT
jgi:hypothetical protein